MNKNRRLITLKHKPLTEENLEVNKIYLVKDLKTPNRWVPCKFYATLQDPKYDEPFYYFMYLEAWLNGEGSNPSNTTSTRRGYLKDYYIEI